MKLKLLPFLSAAILAMASTVASADPIVIGAQVPGSDPSSEPCTPKERTDDYHKNHFSADISGSQGKDFDVVLFGDSITDFWNNPSLALDGNPLNYAAAFNMGIGSDRVQNLLWRLRNGALDGYTTKYFTLMVGINNGHQKCIDHNEHADRAEDVAESIRLMLCEMATKHPDAKILLMPILPYSFDSRYFEAAEVTAMSEAVNDYILQFVDNKRVFWVDLRSQYLQQNSMPDKTCYREGGHGGYDAVGLCLHPEFFTYSDFWRPALTNAMQKYLSVPAGQAQTADPSIGYAKAAPNVDGAGSATITVFGISLGRDANANAVTSYSIDYELDGGTKTRALSGQTGTRASFAIPNVALGDHTCKVTVTTADNKELVTLLSFTMTEPWYASPLPTDDSAVRTDGTLKYAYAPAACTVNGVAFAAAGNSNAAISGDISWPYSQTSGASAPSSVSGAYYELLNRCWWANQGDKEVTLKNLEAGRSYLVQIFGYRNYNGDGKAHVWIKESYWDPNFIKVYGDGWSCGGTLTGTFTATETTKTFTITSDGNYGINGIQVRDLGESGVPVVVLPKIGSVSVSTNGSTATISLSGVVMGTDDEGTNATSYAVSYRLGDAAAVQALTGQAGATASFDIANLADGEYTCAVSITTDKNKTSAEKTVSFRIGTPPPPVVARGSAVVPFADGWTAARWGGRSDASDRRHASLRLGPRGYYLERRGVRRCRRRLSSAELVVSMVLVHTRESAVPVRLPSGQRTGTCWDTAGGRRPWAEDPSDTLVDGGHDVSPADHGLPHRKFLNQIATAPLPPCRHTRFGERAGPAGRWTVDSRRKRRHIQWNSRSSMGGQAPRCRRPSRSATSARPAAAASRTGPRTPTRRSRTRPRRRTSASRAAPSRRPAPRRRSCADSRSGRARTACRSAART